MDVSSTALTQPPSWRRPSRKCPLIMILMPEALHAQLRRARCGTLAGQAAVPLMRVCPAVARSLLLGRPDNPACMAALDAAAARAAESWMGGTDLPVPVAELLRLLFLGQDATNASQLQQALQQIRSWDPGCTWTGDDYSEAVMKSRHVLLICQCTDPRISTACLLAHCYCLSLG
jgi:hypothetical protein